MWKPSILYYWEHSRSHTHTSAELYSSHLATTILFATAVNHGGSVWCVIRRRTLMHACRRCTDKRRIYQPTAGVLGVEKNPSPRAAHAISAGWMTVYIWEAVASWYRQTGRRRLGWHYVCMTNRRQAVYTDDIARKLSDSALSFSLYIT